MDELLLSLMQTNVVTVSVDASIDEVEATLYTHQLTCVPVIDADGKCFGVISAVDLVYFHHLRRNSRSERAWEVCTHKVIDVSPHISIDAAAELMVAHGVHHLVAIENNSIKGIVSSLDLIRCCLLKHKV